jgi:conjugative transfer signal peptidase TraF
MRARAEAIMAERVDLPLFAWRARADAARRERARQRLRVGVALAGIGCMTATLIAPPLPRLVWNASASAPVGLYGVAPGVRLSRGDMVIAWPPAAMRRLAAQRRYLPVNVPLVKRVAAVAGDRVCASADTVSVNGRTIAVRRMRDAAGRRMPIWTGCVRLDSGALFLLMTATPSSFDGRYFGITMSGDVIGKAIPLWVR